MAKIRKYKGHRLKVETRETCDEVYDYDICIDCGMQKHYYHPDPDVNIMAGGKDPDYKECEITYYFKNKNEEEYEFDKLPTCKKIKSL